MKRELFGQGWLRLNHDGLIEAFAVGGVSLGAFEEEDDALNALPEGPEAKPKAAGNGGSPPTRTNEKPEQGSLAPASSEPAPSKPGLSLKEFLQLVVPWDCGGYFSVHWQRPGMKGFPGHSFQTIDAALITDLQAGPHANIYFCLSRHNGRRDRDNAIALQAVWMDIDVDPADDKKYSTVAEAIVSLFWFCDQLGIPRPSFIVASGGGVHAYWLSRRALAVNEWQLFANALKAVAKNSKLKLDAGVTGDAARVLRVPDTNNWKYGAPRPVYLLPKYCTGIQHDFAAVFEKILGENTIPSGRPKIAEAFKNFELKNLGEGIVIDEIPLQPFEPIKAECGWLRTAYETGGKQYEQPQWNLKILCATFMENGRELAHLLSNKHPNYTVAETDEKFDIKLRERQNNPKLGWPSCKTIRDAQPSGQPSVCDQCQHFSKGKSPLHLAMQWGQEYSKRRAEQIAENIKIGDDVTESLLPQIMSLAEMHKRLVFIGSTGGVADLITCRVRKKESAVDEYAASQHTYMDGAKLKKVPALNLWIASKGRLTVEVLAWVPGAGQICQPPEGPGRWRIPKTGKSA
jgi:hypothetical protein